MIKDMLRLLSEAAEEVSLPKEPTSAAPISGDTMNDATDFAPQPPAPVSAAMAPIPAMPTVNGGNNVVQKDMLDKDIVTIKAGELKTIVSNFEKTFAKQDFTVEDSAKYISSFLKSLAFYAEQLKDLAGIGADEIEDASLDMPQEDILPPEEPIMDETPVETGTLPEEQPVEGEVNMDADQFTDPFATQPSEFTNPNEASDGVM